MFTIADNRHKSVPSFLKKLLTDGTPIITTSLSEAMIFHTNKEAIEALNKVPKSDLFMFQVFELGIIN